MLHFLGNIYVFKENMVEMLMYLLFTNREIPLLKQRGGG
ncbi:hypothetical protein EMIT079MI2_60063 [Bacillus sp. IT-79MI2]